MTPSRESWLKASQSITGGVTQAGCYNRAIRGWGPLPAFSPTLYSLDMGKEQFDPTSAVNLGRRRHYSLQRHALARAGMQNWASAKMQTKDRQAGGAVRHVIHSMANLQVTPGDLTELQVISSQ